MKKKIRIDTATVAVSLIALAILVIALIVAVSTTNKKDSSKPNTPPSLTFPQISDVPQRDDITVNFSESTLEDVYEKDGTEYIYSFISFPVIEGGCQEATEKINEAIRLFANERVAIKQYEKENAEEAYKRAENEAMGFIQFEFVTTTESVYVKNGYASIAFRRVRTVGLNDPSELITTMCFDLISGEEVDLSVFMNVGQDMAMSFILDIFAQHIRINPNVYYNDALDTLPDVLDLKSFYLTADGVVLYFNPNVITPSVNGVQRFTVPFDKIGY